MLFGKEHPLALKTGHPNKSILIISKNHAKKNFNKICSRVLNRQNPLSRRDMIKLSIEKKTIKGGQVMQWTRPKSVRQIGEIPGRGRIYMEDYVIRFVKRLAEQSHGMEKAAVLLGASLICDGEKIYQISGVVEIHNFAGRSGPKFTDEDWDYIYSEMKENFTDLEIVGWFYSCQGFSVNQAGQLLQVHKLNFEKRDKVLYLYDETDGEDSFFLYRSGQLEKQKGYYIYYEKNPEMQNYMINTRRENGVTPSEVVEDRAAKDFRSAVREKMEYKEQHQSSKFAYITSALLVLIVLVIGITTVNNFDKMKSVQTSLENLSKSMENGQTEEDTKTTTAAEAKEGAKEVSGTVKKSEEAKVSKEEESQLTDKDYYVVQKGETLAGISKKLYGDTSHVKAICKMNGLSDGNLIYIGQKLLLP